VAAKEFAICGSLGSKKIPTHPKRQMLNDYYDDEIHAI
jgi:hypothetical protein